MPVQATGMLEYVSKTALVIRLADGREIHMAIPGSMPQLENGRELGDWVDVSYKRAGRVLDEELDLNLNVALTDIRDFRKPSQSELEAAEASPIRKFKGNLLAKPDQQPAAVQSGLPTADLFAEVRARVKAYLAQLPNLTAEETTERLKGSEDSPEWTAVDHVAAQVRFDGRHEVRTNILLNGNAWDRPYETLPGMNWRASYLRMIHTAANSHKVRFEGVTDGTLNGHAVDIYTYNAPPDSISHWYLGEQGFWPAVSGKIWVAKQDGRVLQIEQGSTDFPADFPLGLVTDRVSLDYVQVSSRLETLPVTSEVTWVRRDNGRRFQNKSSYQNYRRATASSALSASN
jgi:hypothetical protein